MAGSWSEFCVLALHSFSCSQLKAYLLALCCDTNLLSATRYMELSVVAESLTAGKSTDRHKVKSPPAAVSCLATKSDCGILSCRSLSGWLGSRVVSMLASSATGPGFKSQLQRCRVTVFRQTVHTHRASVHQAAKLVAAFLRVARVTAGLAESNGSLPLGHLQPDCQEPESSLEPYAR